jgi:hypothetical protein
MECVDVLNQSVAGARNSLFNGKNKLYIYLNKHAYKWLGLLIKN